MGRGLRFSVAGYIAAVALLSTAGTALATFPGTNGKIAFVHFGGPGSNDDIFTMDPNGQNRTQLTTGPETDFAPAYSADGEKIAFTRFPPSGFRGIWVMNHDGSGQTQLTSGSATADDSDPAFSPDGERIAFERYDGSTDQIFIMNADGSGQTQLTFSGPAGDESFEPVFSPNGQKIVFRREDGFEEIWVMNPDGSGQTRLTTGSATSRDFDPDFSPSGQKIVVDRLNGSQDDIWTMSSDGSGQTPVTSGGFDFTPVFAPDGTRIAFEREDAGFTFGNIFLVDPTGVNQNLTPLTGNAAPAFDFAPSWQPLNPPACDLTGKAKQRSVKRVSVTVTCANEDATVVAEGSGRAPKPPKGAVASKAKKFKIPPVTAQIPEGTPTDVTLKVPKKGKKALKKAAKAGKKGKATITATITDDLGQTAQDSFAVKFAAKKKK